LAETRLLIRTSGLSVNELWLGIPFGGKGTRKNLLGDGWGFPPSCVTRSKGLHRQFPVTYVNGWLVCDPGGPTFLFASVSTRSVFQRVSHRGTPCPLPSMRGRLSTPFLGERSRFFHFSSGSPSGMSNGPGGAFPAILSPGVFRERGSDVSFADGTPPPTKHWGSFIRSSWPVSLWREASLPL
jgi:hypothetical protein